jgi:hypothetical protein
MASRPVLEAFEAKRIALEVREIARREERKVFVVDDIGRFEPIDDATFPSLSLSPSRLLLRLPDSITIPTNVFYPISTTTQKQHSQSPRRQQQQQEEQQEREEERGMTPASPARSRCAACSPPRRCSGMTARSTRTFSSPSR